MTSLALLLTWSHEVDGTLSQCGSSVLVGCHRAVFEVLLSLLIPVAGVAGVVNLVERLELERRPVVAVDARTADIDAEAQLRRT